MKINDEFTQPGSDAIWHIEEIKGPGRDGNVVLHERLCIMANTVNDLRYRVFKSRLRNPKYWVPAAKEKT